MKDIREDYELLDQIDAPTSVATVYQSTKYNPTDKGKRVTVWSIVVCNRGATAASFTLWIAPAYDNATATANPAINQNKQLIYKDLIINGNNSFALDLRIGLRDGDRLFAVASNANVAMSILGLNATNN